MPRKLKQTKSCIAARRRYRAKRGGTLTSLSAKRRAFAKGVKREKAKAQKDPTVPKRWRP